MRFEFATAGRIVFGPGVLEQAGKLVREVLLQDAEGAPAWVRVLVVTGHDTRRAEPLLALLRAESIEFVSLAVATEPTVDLVRQGVALARESSCCAVIGMGGGSVVDAGKAVAALAANPADILDYLEVVGRGLPLVHPSLPYMAIPTTAGTGAEVTRNAVVLSPEHAVKASLRSPSMLPRIALVDPQLTYSLPPAVTAATGLDALTQLIEPFVSSRANPLTDCICREGIVRAARSLRRACAEPNNPDAREDMSLAGLFGGLALANAGLGAVHGFAGPIGGMFPAPHGAVCAALLPGVMEVNIRACRQRDAANPAVERYQEVARMLTGRPDARLEDGIDWVRQLLVDLSIPRLSQYGIRPEHTGEIVEKAAAASSMKGNPISLTRDELEQILSAAM